ncbi:hypothetical protein BLNAU_2259 [Blattamonas nauphoetae]|uniref:Uncharacterized protein n=1 Tax=Blattamonas nauphoetae TaxID=2049346 RepID=A0ABQ9YGW4_9EUKA|nr:hypothetical protein BLNAU_2259 [Blattamonas nauphoetae]
MIVREERTSRMHYLNKIITSLVTWLTPPSSFSLPKNIIFWLLVSVALSILLTSSLSLYATCLSRAQAKLTTLSEMFMHRDLASYSGVVPWISINFELNFEAVLLDSLMFVFSFPAFFILMSVGMRGRTEVELDSVVVDQMLTAMTLLLITFQAASILFLHQQTMNAFHRRVFVLFFLFFFVNFAVEKKRGYMKLQSIIVGSLAVTAIVMEMAFGLEMDLSDADVERVDRVLSRFWRAQEDTEEVEEFRREEGMTLEAEEEIVRGRSGTVEREEE